MRGFRKENQLFWLDVVFVKLQVVSTMTYNLSCAKVFRLQPNFRLRSVRFDLEVNAQALKLKLKKSSLLICKLRNAKIRTYINISLSVQMLFEFFKFPFILPTSFILCTCIFTIQMGFSLPPFLSSSFLPKFLPSFLLLSFSFYFSSLSPSLPLSLFFFSPFFSPSFLLVFCFKMQSSWN